jgi:penicillin-binding protein 2
MDRDVFERRLATLIVLIAAMLVVLVVRLWQVQIVQGDYYLKLSEENRLRVTTLAAPRGVLVDRHGRTLVANRPAFTVALLPLELRRPRAEAQAVGKILGMDPAEILARLAAGRDRPFEPVRLKRDVPKEVVAAIEESQLDLPGVLVEIEPVRQYVYGILGAHVFGYTGEINEQELRRLRAAGYEPGDLIGKDGIEQTYDAYIRGRNGQIQAEVDAQGRMVRTLGTVPAVAGDEVVTGLDLAAQQAAETGLGDRRGAVVALDPRTGAVVVFVSHPAFDPNLFSAGITQKAWTGLLKDPARPLLDRAIQGGYPTGSVFKIITGSAALELGLVKPDSRFYCPGYYDLVGHIFHDHEAHGNLNFLDAIAESCNVVFWTISRPVGPMHLAEFARRYGLGSPTGVDLPEEGAGTIPDPVWKQKTWKQPWYAGDTLNTAVGQGYVLTTPMQVARMLAAVANGGTLVTPHVVTEIHAPTGALIARIAPPATGQLRLSAQTMAVLKAGLAAVVSRGTAASIQIPGLAVAGKTGTAEAPHGKPYAWFAGYAPADNPTLVVVAVVEDAGYGAEFAAPIVQKVIQAAFGIGQPAPAPAQPSAPGSPPKPPTPTPVAPGPAPKPQPGPAGGPLPAPAHPSGSPTP